VDRAGPLPLASLGQGFPLEEKTTRTYNNNVRDRRGGSDGRNNQRFSGRTTDLEADRATLQDLGREETGKKFSIVEQEVTGLVADPEITVLYVGNMIIRQ
jgi:hypothetical protein